jgi:septum formation protein
MTKDILYLGSKSKPRQKLVELAEIPFKVLEHESDECGIDLKQNFHDYVLEIAKHKMDHLILPEQPEVIDEQKQERIFVLTVDTLVQSCKSKEILPKPTDKDDAKRMLRILRNEEVEVVTGCCLDVKVWKNGEWRTETENHWTTSTLVEFCVDEELLNKYFEKMPHAMHACTAGIIEGYGANFLKSVKGSYTSVLGLPLYKLRQELKKMGFRSS